MSLEYRKGDRVLSIEQDIDPVDPRDWDNLGTMVCFHKRYNLGDKNDLDLDDFNSWEELEEYLMEEEGAVVMLSLRLYDHSGISMSTSTRYPYNCPWDSGWIGLIYRTQEKLNETGTDKKTAEDILEAEVKTYDQYLRGDIYGFTLYEVKKCDLGYEHREIIDSCWGFYGSDFKDNGLLDHAGIKDLEDWEEL